jgi:hypothetical protein
MNTLKQTQNDIQAMQLNAIQTMTGQTILRIKFGALSDIIILLRKLCLCLTVGLHNPENRDHERDNRQHDQRAIAGFLYRVRAGVDDVDQGPHSNQQDNYSHRSLYGIYHKNTTFLF